MKFRKVLYLIIKYSVKHFLKALISLSQLIVVGCVAIYFDKGLEFIYIFAGFSAARFFYKKTYHSATLIGCTVISAITFGLTCKISPDLGTSMVIQISLGVGLACLFSTIETIRLKLECRKDDKDDSGT